MQQINGGKLQAPIESCAYCGASSTPTIPMTRDHVVPRALFISPRPPMITVPACFTCNQAKMVCDTYFRDYITADMRSHGHETARELFQGALYRSSRRGQSEFLKHFRQESELQMVVTSSGIDLGQWAVAEVDGKPIDDEIRYIVRGLTYHHEKTSLPNPATIFVSHWSADDTEVLWTSMKEAGDYVGPFDLGGDVCSWVYAADGTGRFVWLLSFYGLWNFMAEVN